MSDAKALHSGDYVERFEQAPIERVVRVIEKVDFPANASVGDFGCGTGMLLHALGKREGSYTGIDFSKDFIASAKRWAASEGLTNYRFVESEIVDFCLGHPGAFDIAAALDFAEHVETPIATEIFSAIRGSLKPGGKFYLHTPNLDFVIERAKQVGVLRQFPEHIAVRNDAQMRELLSNSGFDPNSIKIEFIPHYNVLRWLNPLGRLPLVGRLFRARLLITAQA